LLLHKFSPLDIATATIKDNRELALALEESHLELVVQLLVRVTVNPSNMASSPASFNETKMPLNFRIGGVQHGLSVHWDPGKGDKCMEFLQTVVWVDSESNLQQMKIKIICHEQIFSLLFFCPFFFFFFFFFFP